jgi:hypothetical protein
MASAQNNIGVPYQHGWGVAQDHAEAMRWFQKAADQGSAAALDNMGWLAPARSRSSKWPLAAQLLRSSWLRRRSAFLKGFGCRPEHERSIRYKAGVRKPRKKEPAGKR